MNTPEGTAAIVRNRVLLVGCYLVEATILGGLFAYAWGWLP